MGFAMGLFRQVVICLTKIKVNIGFESDDDIKTRQNKKKQGGNSHASNIGSERQKRYKLMYNVHEVTSSILEDAI